MKKLLLLLAALFLLSPHLCSASTGVGLVFGYPGSVGLTMRVDNFPVVALTWRTGNDSYLGTTIDYWFVNEELEGPMIRWYVGLGGYAFLPSFGLGARVPAGLQFYAAQPLEIFLEVVPTLGLIQGMSFNLHAALGVRFHF